MILLIIKSYNIESRAWNIPLGTKAREAAGGIHTDMSKGFIRAEVIIHSIYLYLSIPILLTT